MSAIELAEIVIPAWILLSVLVGVLIGIFISAQNQEEK